MFVFDLSLSTAGITKPSLPALSDWMSESSAENFVYDYPENLKLKEQLNEYKNKINPIRDDPQSSKKFDNISTSCNRFEDLRGGRGILVQNYDAEIVTNAWMKMYECMSLLGEPILDKLDKNGDAEFHSFHIAEAPGNFMVAINHYMFSHYPKLEWRWLANSYRDLYGDSSNYLTDAYGLIRNHKNRWVFGADGDGDITSVANIRSFVAKVENEFGVSSKGMSSGLHFITSDVKFVPPDSNYNEEEWQNIPVQMGHLLSSLVTLRKGGVCMLKEFTFFEAPKTSHLYLLANCFQHLYIVKPETSRPANSEVYVMGIGYKANLTHLQIERLYDIMQYIRFKTEHSPSIFKKSVIPKSFTDRVHKLNNLLVDKQIPALERNIELFRQYEHASREDICRDLSSIRAKSAEEWIKKYGITSLPANRHIAHVKHHSDK
jgi:hypothetical protein